MGANGVDLRLGRWQDVLGDVERVGAVVTDPPYSKATHDGHREGLANTPRVGRRDLPYAHWDPDDVGEFVNAWAPRTRGWFVAMTSHDLYPVYREALEATGRYVFLPIPCVIRGMSVRLGGDGPSSWTVWLVVSRPRTRPWSKWGTLPGAYVVGPGQDRGRNHIGGKPLSLMRMIIGDYTRHGDLVVDPCAGYATTLIAAAIEGRLPVGAESDSTTYGKAIERIGRGWTTSMLPAGEPMEQLDL